MNAEDSLAGALLLSPEKIADIWGKVSPEDFEDGRAGEVLRLAHDHFSKGKPFDPIIASSIHPENTTYYAEISGSPFFGNHKSYASKINDKGRKRRILAGLNNALHNSDESADELLGRLVKLHQTETKVAGKATDIQSVIKRVDELVEVNRKNGRIYGVNTGFDFLDNAYIRYIPGHVWVLTGFTSVGKTSLITEMIQRLEHNRVALISTEMTEEQMVARLQAHHTGIHTAKILSGYLDEKEELHCNISKGNILERSLHIADDIRELSRIESYVMQLAMSGGVDVVFVDYVQNCKVRGARSPYEEQSELAKGLQDLAKKARTCVICLSQVSNSVARGETENLEAKGAGDWSAVADIGVRLKRGVADGQMTNELIFEMKKNRHGALASSNLRFVNNFTRITEEQMI
jgi:replicative DNA helicase